MTKHPKIIKVSGPLVVADFCQGAKMYDMVRVSDKRLIGEIIELKGDLAYIQVYEETSGIGPGEPVYLTNEPLSVELGPGLVSSIYDGIQRPLNLLRDKSGDFISRGLDVAGLDHQRKWHFYPAVKEGEQVIPGDILGTVEETPLIKHKIMVPLGVSGEVVEIKEGDFNVTESVARIKNDIKIKDVNMLQRWPVRKERPVKEKFAPLEPLTTGQRVIDTFFPIAKGGTACIPGPFGAGKCVAGDTPFMLSDGSIVTMGEFYKNCLEKGEVINLNEENIISLRNSAVGLFSMHKDKIAKTSTNILYKGKSDCLLEITTRSGRQVKITPVHKLFRVNEDCDIVETPAKDLHVGDFITAVRKIDIHNDDAPIDPYAIQGVRVADKEIKSEVSRMLKQLIREGRLDVIGESLAKIKQFAYGTNCPPIQLVKKVYNAMHRATPFPKVLRGYVGRGFTFIPKKVNPHLAELLGLFVAEGNTRGKRSLVFTNSEEKLLNHFMDLSNSQFGIRGSIVRRQQKTSAVVISCRALLRFFDYLDCGTGAPNKRIPVLILQSSNESLGAFLRGYYLGDGSYSDGEVEFSTASNTLKIALSYALTRFGILHTLGRRRIKGKVYYRIFIRGKDNLILFYNTIRSKDCFEKIEKIKGYIDLDKSSYTSIDIVPFSPEKIKDFYYKAKVSYTHLKSLGIEINNYFHNKEHMSAKVFKQFAAALKEYGVNKSEPLFKLSNLVDYIFCDRVVSIEEIPGPMDVYDFTVPEVENFVGGFGGVILHNTVTMHEIAKWSDAQIIVYVACGERGNECADLLLSFPELKDPRTGRPLLERTVIVANTSNMPVAAREASIYTGITIAEYFRDMGYSVAVMADSTSRWAEALREMSGRLEEMPGEEGYPAYLSSRIAEFYERAGKVTCLGKDSRSGALSIMGAVSPPGGDISDPVVQATLRVVKVFWGLDDKLANARHFPAINWLLSYSLYHDNLKDFLKDNICEEFIVLRKEAMRLLEEEASLLEIARLVGIESLSFEDRLVLEVAKSIREDFLHQNAFHEVDTYTSLKKQHLILKVIMLYYTLSKAKIKEGADFERIASLAVREKISRLKYIPEDNLEEFAKIEEELRNSYA